jgi:hypothetical protein
MVSITPRVITVGKKTRPIQRRSKSRQINLLQSTKLLIAAWRTRILSEMARAVREAPFDGLHLDQYGFPTEQAFGPPPGSVPYDLAADFPPFIDDAHSVVSTAAQIY